MSAKSATLAKSLHTVTVLVNVARLAPVPFSIPDARMSAYRVGFALQALGYADAPDTYGLAARAVAILEKDAQ